MSLNYFQDFYGILIFKAALPIKKSKIGGLKMPFKTLRSKIVRQNARGLET
jgi:hypothetical protein